MEHEDNTNTQFEQSLQNSLNYINMENVNLQQMNLASSSIDVIDDASGSKYDEDFNRDDDDELKYAKEVQQSEKPHAYKVHNDGYCYGDDFAERETKAFASDPQHLLDDYNYELNNVNTNGDNRFVSFGEGNLNGVDDVPYIAEASQQLDTPSVDEDDISKNGISSSTGVFDAQQPSVNEDGGDDNQVNNVDESSIASNITAQINDAVPQVDLHIEMTHHSEQHNQQDVDFINDQDETSSLADNTTNGTSSMSENVPPSSNDAYLLDMAPEALNEQEDLEKNYNFSYLEGEQSIGGSVLNPEAKEFVPKNGEGSSKPASPVADAENQINPFDDNSTERNSVSNFYSNVLPKHLAEDDDEIVAASPRKGSATIADIVVMPRALSEFAQEANQRPHEVDQELHENNQQEYQSNENDIESLETFEESIKEQIPPGGTLNNFVLETTSLMDHGPETSVDVEVEYDYICKEGTNNVDNDDNEDEGDEDDIMRRSMYVNPDERIQDQLNSVQPLPLNELDSLNNSFSEELASSEVLRGVEQFHMEDNVNESHTVFNQDMCIHNEAMSMYDIDEDINMQQQYQRENSFSGNLSVDETTKITTNEFANEVLKVSNCEDLPHREPTLESLNNTDFDECCLQEPLNPYTLSEKHLTEETKESQSLNYYPTDDLQQRMNEMIINSSDDGNLTQKEEDDALQATTAINMESTECMPDTLDEDDLLMGSNEKMMTDDQLVDDIANVTNQYENAYMQPVHEEDEVVVQNSDVSAELEISSSKEQVDLEQLSVPDVIQEAAVADNQQQYDEIGAGDTQTVKNIHVEDTKVYQQEIVATDVIPNEKTIPEYDTELYNDISVMKGIPECNNEICNEIGAGDAPVSILETKEIVQPVYEKEILDDLETYIPKAQLSENEIVTVAEDTNLESVVKVETAGTGEEIESIVETIPPLPETQQTEVAKTEEIQNEIVKEDIVCIDKLVTTTVVAAAAAACSAVALAKVASTVADKKPDVNKKPTAKATTTATKSKTAVTQSAGTATKRTTQTNETMKKTNAAATKTATASTLSKPKVATSKVGANTDRKSTTATASNAIRKTSGSTTSAAKTLVKGATSAPAMRSTTSAATTKTSAPKTTMSATRKPMLSSQGNTTTSSLNKNRPISTVTSTAPTKATLSTATASNAAPKSKTISPRLTLTSQMRKTISATNSSANKVSTAPSTFTNTINTKSTTTTARMKLTTTSSAAPKPLSARSTPRSTTTTTTAATTTAAAAKRATATATNTAASSANGLTVKPTTTTAIRKTSPIKSVSGKTPTKTTNTLITSPATATNLTAKAKTTTSNKTPNKSSTLSSPRSANKPIKKPTKDPANTGDIKSEEQMENINGVMETETNTTAKDVDKLIADMLAPSDPESLAAA